MGGRGSSSGMSGGGGARGGGSAPFGSANSSVPSGLQSSMDFYNTVNGSRGRALTSQDVSRFGEQLDRVSVGTEVYANENNRYYTITDTYTKTNSGWQYVRKNGTTGDVYENRNVSSKEVAGQVLSTTNSNDPMYWNFRPGR